MEELDFRSCCQKQEDSILDARNQSSKKQSGMKLTLVRRLASEPEKSVSPAIQ